MVILSFLLLPSLSHSGIVNLGLNKEKPKEATLQVYKEFFEDEFLKATDVYYNAESTEFISLNSVADFMKKVFILFTYFSLLRFSSLTLKQGRNAPWRGSETCSTIFAPQHRARFDQQVREGVDWEARRDDLEWVPTLAGGW